MFIQPWDAARSGKEWQDWLAKTDRFGVLAVNNLNLAEAPFVLPTHFTLATNAEGEPTEILVHFARPNEVWPHLEAANQVRLAIMGDYAFIPGHWRTQEGVPIENGVPTSYYSAVQFVCEPTVVDDPDEKSAILLAQMNDFQPEGIHAEMTPEAEPYGRMLSGLRAVRLRIIRVEAKFKFDDHKSEAHQLKVAVKLDGRHQGLDAQAAAQTRRRLAEG